MKTLVLLLSVLFLFIGCESIDEGSEGSENTADNLSEPTVKVARSGKSGKLSNFLKTKQYAALTKLAGEILAHDEYDLKALAALGISHLVRGQTGAAEIFFTKALKKHKNEPGLYNNLGVIEAQRGNIKAAVAQFQKAYNLETRNASTVANLGGIYVKYMDYKEAEQVIEDAYDVTPNNLAVANNYGIILRYQQDYQKAAGVYTKALKLDRRNIPITLNLAILYIEYMKKYNEGEQYLNKLEFLNSNDPYVERKKKALENKMRLARRAQINEAVKKAVDKTVPE